MNALEYQWQEHSLGSVMNHFKKGFVVRDDDDEILGAEWFIDTEKKTVLFKITVRKKVQERKL